MSITLIPTRYEFSHDGYDYLATRQKDTHWTLRRWPSDAAHIPPTMESLYTDGWQNSLHPREESLVTFPHTDGIIECFDPFYFPSQ